MAGIGGVDQCPGVDTVSRRHWPVWPSSVAVSMHEGGKIWNVPSDGSRWMNYRASSACARIVQLSWGMNREQ
eukprot:8272453-Karenia_brevis.AAC.1